MPTVFNGLLDQYSDRILSSVAKYTSNAQLEISQELAKGMSQLASRLDDQDYEKSLRSRREIMEEMWRLSSTEPTSNKDLEVVSKIEMLSVSSEEEKLVRTRVRSKILASLKYQFMVSRVDSITNAHAQTFQWACEGPKSDQLHWDNLAEWLRCGSGLYWMNGKPGSGKSTLMKHIINSNAARQHLRAWAADEAGYDLSNRLCIASFFFWNSGTDEQKSKAGMLRAIIFSVLEEWPDLIPVLFPEVWAEYYSQELSLADYPWMRSWSTQRLEAAFRYLLNQNEYPLKLFLLIDGLDECGDDHEELASLLKTIADRNFPNVKACISSRRLLVFKDHFCGCAQLNVPDLTFNDISQYAQDTFQSNKFYQKLRCQNIEAADELI